MRKGINAKLKLSKETLIVLGARDLDDVYGGLTRITCEGGGCSSPTLSCPGETCAACNLTFHCGTV